jgi:uncharacterized protein (DUF111 family)
MIVKHKGSDMRVLHFDMISGIAGDMTVAALTHLGAPLDPLRQALENMGLPQVLVSTEAVRPSGIGAMSFCVRMPHEHSHRYLKDVLGLLEKADLPSGAHQRAESVFRKLAQAEAAVHDKAVEDVSFHEVGALDSITDIVGCALAMDWLKVDKVSASPPLLGLGLTVC